MRPNPALSTTDTYGRTLNTYTHGAALQGWGEREMHYAINKTQSAHQRRVWDHELSASQQGCDRAVGQHVMRKLKCAQAITALLQETKQRKIDTSCVRLLKVNKSRVSMQLTTRFRHFDSESVRWAYWLTSPTTASCGTSSSDNTILYGTYQHDEVNVYKSTAQISNVLWWMQA